jgi:hypothetical protein
MLGVPNVLRQILVHDLSHYTAQALPHLTEVPVHILFSEEQSISNATLLVISQKSIPTFYQEDLKCDTKIYYYSNNFPIGVSTGSDWEKV